MVESVCSWGEAVNSVNSSPRVNIDELEFEAIRASGPGGQHVNKVSTAIHCRFDINASSLPAGVKQRLLATRDRRISADGILIIKAQRYRSLDRNRQDAVERIQALIDQAAQKPVRRIPTRPGKAARSRRMDQKTRRGQLKSMRSRRLEQDD